MTTTGKGAPNGNVSAGQSNGNKDKEPTHTPRWVSSVEATCAVLLVIITGTYTYLAAGQLNKMRQAVSAAEGANALARTTMIVGQRAFVSFTNQFDVRSGGQDAQTGQKAWAVIPHMRNSGNTAALNLHTYTNINSPDYKEFPPNFDYADRKYKEKGAFPNSSEGGPIIVAAHEDTGGALIGIPDAALEGVNHGTAHVYLWGWVRYDDIFGCGHLTRFCKEFTYRDPTGSLYFDNCAKNNCADKTCKDYQPTDSPVCKE